MPSCRTLFSHVPKSSTENPYCFSFVSINAHGFEHYKYSDRVKEMQRKSITRYFPYSGKKICSSFAGSDWGGVHRTLNVLVNMEIP